MKKVAVNLFFILLFGLIFIPKYSKALAQVCSVSPNTIDIAQATNTLTTTLGSAYNLSQIKDVQIHCNAAFVGPPSVDVYIPKDKLTLGSDGKTISVPINTSDLPGLVENGIKNIRDNPNNNYCELYVHLNDGSAICHAQNISLQITSCGIFIPPDNVIQAAKQYSVSVTNIPTSAQNVALYVRKTNGFTVGGTLIQGGITPPRVTANSPITHDVDTQVSIYVVGDLFNTHFSDWGFALCEQHYTVGEATPNEPGTNNPGTQPGLPGNIQRLDSTDICRFTGPSGSDQHTQCVKCVANQNGIWTALGCISANPQDFVAHLLQVAIGIAGGIAFLMIIYGGFQIMISSGNPEKLNSGREIVTSAIAGLLLIIFSVVILKIIGVDVLNIPGLK